MKQLRVILLLATGLVPACMSGPNYCQRKVDDWQNELYVKNPIVSAAVTDIVPGFLILKILAFIPDFIFLNPTQFWIVDLWRNKGARYRHSNPSGPRPWFADEFGDSE